MRVQRTLNAFLSPIMIAFIIIGCSTAPAPKSSKVQPQVPAKDAVTLLNLSEQVHRVSNEASPTFQIIERQGDPAGAISVAIAVAGGSRNALIMMGLVSEELETAGFNELELSPSALGFVASSEIANKAEILKFVRACHEALTNKVAAESSALSRVDAFFASRSFS
jgi:hypothetical protein